MEKEYYRYNTDKCRICGEEHENNILCPVIFHKLKKAIQYKPRNFLYANVLLECIKHKRHIYDLFCECCYIDYFLRNLDSKQYSILNADFFINYCASELNCSPKNFFMSTDKTIEKLMDVFEYSHYNRFDENDNDITFEFYSLEGIIEKTYDLASYPLPGWWDGLDRFYAEIEKDTEGKTVYQFYMEIPRIKLKLQDKTNIYMIESLYNWDTSSLLLAEDYDGALAKRIQKIYDDIWYELAEVISEKDSRFDFWVKRLKEATIQNKLYWEEKDGVCTTYCGKYQARIHLDIKDKFEDQNDHESLTHHQFSIRVEEHKAIAFIPQKLEKIGSLRNLQKLARNSINNMKNLSKYRIIPEKRIGFADVLVVNSSMYCKNEEHNIAPYRGIIEIITEDNRQEEYHIYVGYCIECGTYTVFKADYEEMLTKGRPLCAVYNAQDCVKDKEHTKFAYKSQSILALKGYTVQANSELSKSDRQNILKECIDSGIVQIHDVLQFLNWLVRSREPLPKYSNAISKWKDDIAFVQNYKKEERETVKIKSLTVK